MQNENYMCSPCHGILQMKIMQMNGLDMLQLGCLEYVLNVMDYGIVWNVREPN